MPPLFVEVLLKQAVRQHGRIVSVRADVAAGFPDAHFVLRVVHNSTIVYEHRAAMTNVENPKSTDGRVALSTWSGTLYPRLWKGGCGPGIYTVIVHEMPLQSEQIKESGGFKFLCRGARLLPP
jgi:hypothetical protein